jgi:hypothetical protein
MTKILELNGFKYSRKQFEGYTHRLKFELDVVNQEWKSNIDIYTNNEDKRSVYNVISELTTDKVKNLELVNWTTKEQDDLDVQFLEETLKDL